MKATRGAVPDEARGHNLLLPLSLVAIWCSGSLAAVAAPGPARPALRSYETPYYLIHTDLDPPLAAEAVVRLTRLAEVYRARTRALGFTGRIRQRLPVYLFKNRADYLATGAPPESAGAFLGDRVVAVATDKAGGPAWHVVQHEAFHQFSAAVDGPELPGWVTEGLGEYFGEALFTGDGYVAGVVPKWRADRVKQSIKAGTFRPLGELLAMSQDDWNEKIAVANYDQAWALVQYLLHGRGAEAPEALARFVKALAAGRPPGEAWAEAFEEPALLDRRWRHHWLSLPAEPAAEKYAEAAAAAATSFLARASAAGQGFDSFEQFAAAARRGEVRCRPDDWLPLIVLHGTLHSAPAGAKWKLDGAGVTLELHNRVRFAGTFRIDDGRVKEVTVRRVAPDPNPEPRTPNPEPRTLNPEP